VSDHWIYGLHATAACVARTPERMLEVCVQDTRHDARLLRLLAEIEAVGLRPRRVPRDTLDKFSAGGTHQGIIVRVRAAAARDERWLEEALAAHTGSPLLLVLDGVQDPHNLGACLRSADAAGALAVIVPRDRAASLTPVARKAACGAAESMPFIQVTNLARTLRRLKELGLWTIGADAEGEQAYERADLTLPTALVLGAEGSGLRRLTRECCDVLVRIPMQGLVESLNVSVTAGVLLFEAQRQRRLVDASG
jgi:23S rRNA (guanosine2251-2'-O)-methyltransferase